MKQLLLIVAAVVIIALAGTGFYLIRSQESNTPDNNQTYRQIGENQSTMTTLKSLLSLGTSQTCTFSYADPDSGTTQGTVYFANGKMRGNFTVQTVDGQSFDSSTINDGSYIYSWSSMSNQGTKIPVDYEVEESMDKDQGASSEYFNVDKEIDYNCNPWSDDQSMFTTPSNITFTDISSQMMQINETTNDLQEQKCAACDNLTGEQLQACKQALSCN